MSDINIYLSQIDEHEWCFEFPTALDYSSDILYDAMDGISAGAYEEAEPMLRSIIETCPNHIDAIHHLAIIMRNTGREIEAFALTEQAVSIGRSCLPRGFSPGADILIWGYLENRGFLRACLGLAVEYINRARYSEALSLSNDIIAMNPDDNQGARALVVQCNFLLNRPSSVINVCSRYPNDTMPDLLYGRVLALLQLDEINEAEKLLPKALEWVPATGKEIVKKTHPKPKKLRSNTVTQGGVYQAYYYWKMYGMFWKKTEGAIDFLNKYVRELPKSTKKITKIKTRLSSPKKQKVKS